MGITYYVRPVGGIKTHVDYLLKYFNARILTPKIIYNYCNGFYVVDKGLGLIKKEMENCDIFHIHHPVATSEFLIPFIFKKMKKKPKIINTIHLAVGDSAYSFIQDTYVKLIASFYKDVSSKIIVVGETQGKLIKGIGGDKVVIIPNGVDTKKYRKRRARRVFKDFTIGYLGRLNMEKNIFSLVKACKRAGVNLAIAGIGPQYKKLKKMENEKLKVLGFVKDEIDFYNSIDVFASVSRIEGHPYTVVEAMSCSKPIVISNFGGGEKALEKCGIVCGKEVLEIENALKKIKNMDLTKIGNNARKLVEKEYDIKQQIEKLNKIYKSVLE